MATLEVSGLFLDTNFLPVELDKENFERALALSMRAIRLFLNRCDNLLLQLSLFNRHSITILFFIANFKRAIILYENWIQRKTNILFTLSPGAAR